MSRLTPEKLRQLCAPFPPGVVQFKQNFPYIKSKDVIARITAVMGADWEEVYTTVSVSDRDVWIPPNERTKEPGRHEVKRHFAVYCQLTIGGVTRGCGGEGMKEDEAFKSACSDALKRAARKFGIGLHFPADNKRGTFYPEVVLPTRSQVDVTAYTNAAMAAIEAATDLASLEQVGALIKEADFSKLDEIANPIRARYIERQTLLKRLLLPN